MKVEFVGTSPTHGYVHDETTNLKKLAKQITDETGYATDINAGAGKSADTLIVGGNAIPVGGAVVIKNGGIITLSAEAFNSQYREVVDFDVAKLEDRVDKLEAFNKEFTKELAKPAPKPKKEKPVEEKPVEEKPVEEKPDAKPVEEKADDK